MKRKQAVVLNSGGFDSVCLLHEVVNTHYYQDQVLSIFFNYGQVNLEQERECAKKVAYKLNVKHMEVEIAPISWSNSAMYSKGNAEYLEMRNLIFLSYATSIAERVKATDIYMAVLYGGTYSDTKPEFIEAYNKLLNVNGMNLVTPFIEDNKFTLMDLVKAYDIKQSDFFSCNFPTENKKPCGVCNDCIALNSIYEEISKPLSVHEIWCKNGFTYSEEFEEMYWESKIDEMRLLINNQCQFKCTHCFYGFENTTRPIMSKDMFKKAIDEAVKFGIENIHFSGKEPFFNTDIFEYMKYIDDNYTGVLTYDVVTNGVTIPKYRSYLRECKNLRRIYLSVDNLGDTVIRPTSKTIMNSIEVLLEEGIDIQIFLDVHKDNYLEIPHIIKRLYEKGIYSYHVRNVLPIGSGKSLDNIISVEEYNHLFVELCQLNFDRYVDIEFKLSKAIAIPCTQNKKYFGLELSKALFNFATTGCHKIRGTHLILIPQFFCNKFLTQVTMTPDGYMLGCGTDVATKKYANLSSGNFQEELELLPLVKHGRKVQLERIKNVCSLNEQLLCHHTVEKEYQ